MPPFPYFRSTLLSGSRVTFEGGCCTATEKGTEPAAVFTQRTSGFPFGNWISIGTRTLKSSGASRCTTVPATRSCGALPCSEWVIRMEGMPVE